MNKLAILLLMTVTFSISYVVAESDVQKSADSAAEATKEKKDAFVKKMELEIEKISEEIEELRVKTKDKSKATVEKLETRKEDLQVELKKLKKSSSKAYDKVEDGVKKAWTTLKDSLQSAKKEFE